MFIKKISNILSIILIGTCINYFEIYSNKIEENMMQKIANNVRFAKNFSTTKFQEKWWYDIVPNIPYKITLGFMNPDGSGNFSIYTHMSISNSFKRKGNIDKIKSYGSSWNPSIIKIESFDVEPKQAMNDNKVGLKITFRQKISKNSYNDVVAHFKFVKVVSDSKTVADMNASGMNPAIDKKASKFLFGVDDLINSATVSKQKEEETLKLKQKAIFPCKSDDVKCKQLQKRLEYKYLLPCNQLENEKEKKRCEEIHSMQERGGGGEFLTGIGADLAQLFGALL